MSPNEWQLLPSGVLASSSCLIWPVLCVTFAEHRHSPGGNGGNYKKDWNLNIVKCFFVWSAWNKSHKNHTSMLGEVGLRWALGCAGASEGRQGWGFRG